MSIGTQSIDGIEFLCYTSAEWRGGVAKRPLRRGEPAFEIISTTEDKRTLAVLVGDGKTFPNNEENLRALRLNADSFTVTIDNDVRSVQEYIGAILNAVEKQREDFEQEKQNNAEINLKHQALLTELKGFLITLDNQMAALSETSVQHGGDIEALQKDVDTKLDKAPDGEHPLINNNRLSDEYKPDYEPSEILGLAEEFEKYAPLVSPKFKGVPEVPYPADNKDAEGRRAPYNVPSQALPVRDFLELYGFVERLSGDYTRKLDIDQTKAADNGMYYLRELDKEGEDGKEYSAAEYREADHLWITDYVDKEQWQYLYDILMSTAGDRLRLLDIDGEKDIVRILDRAWGRPEMREIDWTADCWFQNSIWVEI